MIMRRIVFHLIAVVMMPLSLYAQAGDDDCHDPAAWQHIRDMAKLGEVDGNIQMCINDYCRDTDPSVKIEDLDQLYGEELSTVKRLQSILARGDVDAFVGLSSERFLDLLRKRYVVQLGKKAPPRKEFREFWRSKLRSDADPLGMNLLFSIKKEWLTDSWWRVEDELPIDYRGKSFPAFSVIVCFDREGKGPFQHVAFTFVKENGKYLLIDFDADWEEQAGPFFGRQYGL
jgi:hypothetical protein